MNAVAPVATATLPAMVQAAADSLGRATTAAQVLEARELAGLAYDAAKRAARLLRAKSAHDRLVGATHRVQADALEIEAAAMRRLADEYDAAQDRGEVRKQSDNQAYSKTEKAGPADIGMSPKTIHTAREVRDAIASNPVIVRAALDDLLAAGDEPTRAALRRAIAPAVKAIRAEAQAEKKERRTLREAALAVKIEALPERRYGVIYADPEWRFEPRSRETGMDRAPDNHYPTSPTADIIARNVESIAANDCALFLWATAPMLLDALAVLSAWGFTYVTHAVWAKQRSGKARGPGYWFTGEHEILLLGTRGHVPAPAPGTQFPSVLVAPVGEHSEKPDIALKAIEAYFPNLPKIELNRRGPARPGWDVWGNEVVAT